MNMALDKLRTSLARTVIILLLNSILTRSTTDVTKASVIIIGAGPSGIAAGTKLYQNGIEDIIWLEAEDRIGGRIYTKEFGDNVIDLGAQWCHGEVGNVVFEMAYPLDLLEHSNFNLSIFETQPSFYDSTGKTQLKENVTHIWEVLNNIKDDSEAVGKSNYSSMGEYFTASFKERMETDLMGMDKSLCQLVFDWFHKSENALDASDSWFEVSIKDEYEVCLGDLRLNWKGRGYRTVLDLLMKKLPDPSKVLPIVDKIHLKKEVTNIDWRHNNEVTVTCADGSVYKADHVLVTVSLGVLKERADKLFTPELPSSTLKAIKGLNFGTIGKLILEFPHRWWPENHHGFNLGWYQNDIENINKKFNGSMEDNLWLVDIFHFHSVEHQSKILSGWIAGASARKMETLPENEVKEKVLQLLDMFLGKDFDIPKPTNFIRTQWHTNPHFRGTYSYRSIFTDELNTSAADLREPLKNDLGRECLFFAGEATHSHHYSTVHGAVETGWREADRIIKLKKKI